MTGTDTVICREHDAVVRAAARCDDVALSRFPCSDPADIRARGLLGEMAGHCRLAATVFDIDPTLATEPVHAGRFRMLDLVCEIARQLPGVLRSACAGAVPVRGTAVDWWVEAEAMCARAGRLAHTIVDVIPRRDHDTVEGAQAISRSRLAIRHDELGQAAALIRAAIEPAMSLSSSTSELGDLAQLAHRLERHAHALKSVHETETDALNDAHARALRGGSQ